MVTVLYSHIIDEDRKNDQLFKEAFYWKKNLRPQLKVRSYKITDTIPERVDAEIFANILGNSEIMVLFPLWQKRSKRKHKGGTWLRNIKKLITTMFWDCSIFFIIT